MIKGADVVISVPILDTQCYHFSYANPTPKIFPEDVHVAAEAAHKTGVQEFDAMQTG